MLNQEVSRPLDAGAGLDLQAAVLPTEAGRPVVRAAIPMADAAALLLALILTSNAHRVGLGFALITLFGLAATGKQAPRLELRVSRDLPAIVAWLAIGLAGTLLLAPATMARHALLNLLLVTAASGGHLGIIGGGQQVDGVVGISLVTVPRPALCRRRSVLVKRALDVVAAFAMLMVSAPIFLGAAAAIRLSSPGPVFFRQRRIG